MIPVKELNALNILQVYWFFFFLQKKINHNKKCKDLKFDTFCPAPGLCTKFSPR